MAKTILQVNKIQPLQQDTITLAPKSYIRGEIGKVVNVVGNALAAKVTLARKAGVSMPSGIYRLEVVVVGATGVGAFKVIDVERGTETQPVLTAAEAISGFISGVDITLADTNGTVEGDYVEFAVDGDQTYIIPGTVVGRYKSDHPLAGKWAPAYDDTKAQFDAFKVTAGFQETDKTQTVAPNTSEINLSDNYTTSVYVYAQLIEKAVHNLTPTLKAELLGLAWE